METDISVCFLTCLGVNGGLQGQKLVEDEPKLLILLRTIPNIQCGPSILCQDIFNDYNMTYIIETDMSVGVLNCFSVYGDLKGQNLIKKVNKSDFVHRIQFLK